MARPAQPPSQPPWRFLYFIEESGACDVMDYLDAVHDTHFDDYVTFRDRILPKLLKDGPHALKGEYWIDIGDGFSEIKWGDHRRIYCCVEPTRRVFALLGIDKRFRAFESLRGGLVKKCIRRRKEIRNGTYNEQQRNTAYNDHRARRRRNT